MPGIDIHFLSIFVFENDFTFTSGPETTSFPYNINEMAQGT